MVQLLTELLLMDLLLPQLALSLLLHQQDLAAVQVVEDVCREVLGRPVAGQEAKNLPPAFHEAFAESGGVVVAHAAWKMNKSGLLREEKHLENVLTSGRQTMRKINERFRLLSCLRQVKEERQTTTKRRMKQRRGQTRRRQPN